MDVRLGALSEQPPSHDATSSLGGFFILGYCIVWFVLIGAMSVESAYMWKKNDRNTPSLWFAVAVVNHQHTMQRAPPFCLVQNLTSANQAQSLNPGSVPPPGTIPQRHTPGRC